MASRQALALDTAAGNKIVRVGSGDDLAGQDTTQGVDVAGVPATVSTAQQAADDAQADVDAHAAAAAPHTGHATTGALTALANTAAAADAAIQAELDAEETARANGDAATAATVTALDAAAEKLARKGQPNGYAELDGSGKVPASQIPVVGGGGGDLFGPSGAMLKRLPRYSNTNGKVLDESVVAVADNGNISGAGTFNGVDVAAASATATSAAAAAAAAQADVDAHELAAAPHTGHATTAALASEIATRSADDATIAAALTGEISARSAGDAARQLLSEKDQTSGYLGIGSDALVDPAFVARPRGRNTKVSRGRIDFVPALLSARGRVLRAAPHFYGDESVGALISSGHRAGLVAIAPNNAGVPSGPIHPDAGSFPFVTLDCSIDNDGYPAYLGKRFHSTNANANSGKDGYELGARIPAGYLRRNEGQRRRVRARLKNAALDAAFFEFAVEPNHRRGVFTQPSRARLLSGPLGFQWSGWLELEAVIDFRYEAGELWHACADYSLRIPGGEEVWHAKAAAPITSGHDFQTVETAFLCYQVQVNDWALVNNYTTYTAQGTGALELVVVSSETEPLEACR